MFSIFVLKNMDIRKGKKEDSLEVSLNRDNFQLFQWNMNATRGIFMYYIFMWTIHGASR